jgi:hypothetical protein
LFNDEFAVLHLGQREQVISFSLSADIYGHAKHIVALPIENTLIQHFKESGQ